MIIFKLIVLIEEIHFILHVANGLHIRIHNVIRYNHTYSNNIIIILVQISLTIHILVQILFCQFLENGNRYNVEIFCANLFFNGLLNDISHFVVTQNFIISTCLRYVNFGEFCKILQKPHLLSVPS